MKVMPLPSNREASEIEMILFLENISASKGKKWRKFCGSGIPTPNVPIYLMQGQEGVQILCNKLYYTHRSGGG